MLPRLMACAPTCLALVGLSLAGSGSLLAQAEPPQRILDQDPSRNNLVTPPGYETASPGELGAVAVSGEGETAMIVIPGFGFGGDVFEPLISTWQQRYRTYAVTLPGFAGTPAPPTPPEGTSFGETTWTSAAVGAVSALIASEGIERAVVVGHWIGGTQVAVQVARRHPDIVDAVVLLAGSARFEQATPDPRRPPNPTLEQRAVVVDRNLAQRWFKTVTRETWDDNNFLPGDYAANPVVGLRLWREAARPALHVWVRYLCEFFAQDSLFDLDHVEAPILLVKPGLEGAYHDPGNDYLRAYTHLSWGDAIESRDGVTVRTIPDTRVVMWKDRPEAVRSAVDEFLGEVLGPDSVARIDVTDEGLVAHLFAPTGAGPHPGILLLGGSGGGIGWQDQMAELLARRGFAALALAYFGMDGLPDQLECIPLEYVERGLEALMAHSKVDAERIGIAGTSKGGELALLVASRRPEVKAVVAFVPSGVVFQSITPRFDRSSSWCVGREEVPYVPYGRAPDGSPIVAYYDNGLDALDADSLEAATIPVERINGPILMFSGRDDNLWPSTRLSQMVVERLDTKGFAHAVEHHAYEDAGHLISSIRDNVTRRGGTDEGNRAAQMDAQRRFVEFLMRHLGV